MQRPYAVEMEDISVRFGGVEALVDVEFRLGVGEVRGLVGKNGAGKSTLMKVLLGINTPNGGQMRVFGKELSRTSAAAEREEHISMIFQEFSLVPDMTVVHNIFLNVEPRHGAWIDDRACIARVRQFFDEIELSIDPNAKVKDLSTSEMQMVEIAKAVLRNKRILLMDEPTAALDADQTRKLFRLIRTLRQKDITIVLISHHLREIMELCDSVTVLRDGRIVLDETMATLSLNRIISEMLGDVNYDAQQRRWQPHEPERLPLLEVCDITSRRRLKPISFAVYPGEVLGLAGLKGSGRTEIFNCLFGIDPILSGAILLDGKPLSIRHPHDAIDQGITLIPENRHTQGLSLAHSLYLNVQLPWMKRIRGRIFINDRLGHAMVRDLIDRLQIKTSHVDATVNNLSGGNQQKVVIAKALGAEPRILLMDDPTYGVDIGAKAEIMKIVDAFTRQGNAVILVSSDSEELLLNCDRILILKDGAIAEEHVDVPRGRLTEEQLEAAIQ